MSGYFDWLCDQIYLDDYHGDLLFELFRIDFYYTHPMDDNRAGDGVWLRRLYSEETGREPEGLDEDPQCSLLEMLIALAKRCEDDIMYDWEIGDRTADWFWMIIDNLGLFDLTDDIFEEDLVYDAADIFMRREYENGGFGCPFPMPGMSDEEFSEFKKKELWVQLGRYLRKKFPE